MAETNILWLAQSDILKRLEPARMDFFSRPECLPGTRVDILQSITTWLITPSDQRILWLHGMAGVGKSTISSTLAESFAAMKRRGAFVRFDRNDKDNSRPALVIRTLCHQLALFHSEIAQAIAASLKNLGVAIESLSLSAQFEQLLCRPLSGLTSLASEGPIIIILDALDECGDSKSRKDLVTVLREGFPKLPDVFRILITSRVEDDIRGVSLCSEGDETPGVSWFPYRCCTISSEVSRRHISIPPTTRQARKI